MKNDASGGQRTGLRMGLEVKAVQQLVMPPLRRKPFSQEAECRLRQLRGRQRQR